MSRQSKAIQNTFTGGEWSPLMGARRDLPKYYSACRTLQNFIVHAQGGAFKRPGFEFVDKVPDRTNPVRLMPFKFSDTDAYVLEFSNLRNRFYRTTSIGPGLVLNTGSKTPTSVATPYTTSQLFDLQADQTGDVAYITHGSHKPRLLTRLAVDSWTLAAPDFRRGPFLDENTTSTTISSSGSAVDASVTLMAFASLFVATHVGALWEITSTKDAATVSGSFTGNTSSSAIAVSLGQQVDLKTDGTWTGTLTLEASHDGGTTWETMYSVSANVDLEWKEDVEDATYRVTMAGFGGTACNFNLVAPAFVVKGVVEITAVASPTSATATVKVALGRSSSATAIWAEGAWSPFRGWPAAVSFFEQRIVYANTAFQPTTFWPSVSAPGGDYLNFLIGADDDDAIVRTIAETQDPIKWLSDDKRLIIGTAGGPYATGATTTTEPMTPTNVGRIERQSIEGASGATPERTSLGHLYVGKGGRRIDELTFSFDRDKLVSTDMTRLSEHLTVSGVVQIALQNRPEPILWCVTADGVLIALTYLREEDVVCWHRHVLGGDATVESVAVIPGVEEDEVWISARIIINSIEERYVCRMKEWATVDGSGDPEDAFLVDFGLTYDGPPVTTITGLDHLEGKTVSVLADGARIPNKTVSSGQITVDNPVEVAQVGLAYTATLKPMKIPQGTLGYGAEKRISHTALNFFNTGYAKIGSNATDKQEITFRDANDLMDTSVPLFTGVKVVNFPGGYEKDGTLIVESDQPLPLTLLSIDTLFEAS